MFERSKIAEPRVRQHRGFRAWTRHGLILAVLCAAVSTSGCDVDILSCPGFGGGQLLDSFTFENPRFIVSYPTYPTTLPSDTFWFSSKDSVTERTVRYGWDRATMLVRDPNTNACQLDAPAAGCDQCEFCSGVPAPCRNSQAINRLDKDAAALVKISDGTEQQLAGILQPYSACLLRPAFVGPSFVVDSADAEYKLKNLVTCAGPTSIATLATHLVTTPLSLVENDVPRYVEPGGPLRFRFHYRLPRPTGQPVRLRENFSPKLLMTKVRVLSGFRDPHTGVVMVDESPDSTTLRRMRPSRIMFLQQFRDGDVNRSPDEGIHRCYLDPTKDDGEFDLTNCRTSPGGPATGNVHATPAYLDTDPATPLDWVLEYRVED